MSERLHEIDGIRGWAALTVVVFHLTWNLFGLNFPQYQSYYFAFFLDGPLAVSVFFILSGDALSNGYLRTKSRYALSKLAIKRYFRLAGPILLSCAITYSLLKLNLTFNVEASHSLMEAAHIRVDEEWLGTFLRFDADFIDMLRYALLKVFIEHSTSDSYNPFLWPMAIELCGSFFIFGFLLLVTSLKKPLLTVSLVGGFYFLLGSLFSLFFIGFAFAILRENGFFERIKNSSKSQLSFIALSFIIITDAILQKYSVDSPHASILMAGTFVFLIYANEKLINFFSIKVSRYLGRISFPLYISHFSVIVTYTSWSIKHYYNLGLLDLPHSAFIVVSSIVFALLLAEIIARLEQVYLHRLDMVVVG
jgi:peptidoglycan/LPS O-acetylase OafA/YrhL